MRVQNSGKIVFLWQWEIFKGLFSYAKLYCTDALRFDFIYFLARRNERIDFVSPTIYTINRYIYSIVNCFMASGTQRTGFELLLQNFQRPRASIQSSQWISWIENHKINSLSGYVRLRHSLWTHTHTHLYRVDFVGIYPNVAEATARVRRLHDRMTRAFSVRMIAAINVCTTFSWCCVCMRE